MLDSATYERADPYLSTNTLESRFRSRRFEIFRPLLEAALAEKEFVEIVDLGGTEIYWNIARDFLDSHRGRIRITLVNLEHVEVKDHTLFRSLIGDACDPDLFEDNSFDFVHSNSVIEHVGDWSRVEMFAGNVLRLGKRHYVQTPNFWFPLEPHFRMFAYQWLPVWLRTWMLTRWNLGFYAREPDWNKALDVVRSINLLNNGEMQRLFAGSVSRRERIAGLAKSNLVLGTTYPPEHLSPQTRAHLAARTPCLVPEMTDYDSPAEAVEKVDC